jgi:hypothetical protein
MVIRELGDHYLSQLNTANDPYDGYWHLIAPNRRAVDNEHGGPYLYKSIEEAIEDKERLMEFGDYSTCR